MATPTSDSNVDGEMSSRLSALADMCKEIDVKVSYVVQDYGHEDGATPQESDASKRLRNFFDMVRLCHSRHADIVGCGCER